MDYTWRCLSRLVRPLALGALLTLTLLAAPAEACGCGGYIPNGGDATVTQEHSLLAWDGHTEQIVMALGVLGSSKEAAVVLPVPSRATVKLGDAKVFDQLSELTKPLIRREKRYVFPSLGGAAAPPLGAGAPVTLLERQTLGPFEVSNLAATDTQALFDWLKQNGYTLSPGLATALQPYVAQGWFYVAVRLRPGAGNTLKGSLDPLWVTFDASKLVYPMRTSANERQQEKVTLYVLAGHRVQKTENFGNSQVSFADWIEPAAIGNGSALAPFVKQKLFLTKFEEAVNPAQVNDDFNFTFADKDESYHEYTTVYEDDNSVIYLCLVGLGLLVLLPFALLFGLVLILVRRRRRASTTP